MRIRDRYIRNCDGVMAAERRVVVEVRVVAAVRGYFVRGDQAVVGLQILAGELQDSA